jgi:Flp pilus assembly protein TadD
MVGFQQMSKSERKQRPRLARPAVPQRPGLRLAGRPLLWALGVCAVTAVTFSPMFGNGFTNWDDPFYITENALLRGPDWAGILSQPVVSNYHPLTVATLALNYQLSGLAPRSYHVVNWLLHILNTGLVFGLAYLLSDGQRWVGATTALWFGVHPLHVESVAWASERKDVLYTLFFVAALLCYVRYLRQREWKAYGGALGLFVMSLMSKPAAVVLPVVLLLLDGYRGRSLKDRAVWLEKIPFFALALAFGVLALRVQAEKAIAQPESYPMWQRLVFAGYGFGEYIKRFFWPFPLSAVHPFPPSGVVPVAYYPSLLVTAATGVAVWHFRRIRYVVFGVGFYAVTVALVLQLLTFGNSVISERYTYVPYIGLAFALAMAWATSSWSVTARKGVLGVFLLAGLGLAVLSNRQVRVWRDSQTLWTQAIAAYPNSHVARANRGNYLATKLKRYDEGLADYTVALQSKPDHAHSLENRAIIYLHQQDYESAFADAGQLVRFHPDLARGYFLRAFAADRLGRTDQAVADYTECIARDPQNEEALTNLGIIYFNTKQDYRAARASFDAAIRINPNKGANVLNRARCWTALGNKAEALSDIETAKRLGEKVGDDLIQAARALP